MKATSQISGKATLWCGVLAASAIFAAHGQTLINLGTQGRNIDFSNAPSTRPEKTGPTLPATCLPGELFFELAAPAGQNLYSCVAANTWMLVGGYPGLTDPGSNGIVVRTAPNTTKSVAAPTGAVVGTTDTQTLTNKSLTKSEITDLPTFPSGTLVGTTDTQPLTNKTVDGVTPTTFSFLDATSSIQNQLNAKQPLLSLPLAIANGGTGVSSVTGLTSANGNCVLSGNWPNQSIACAMGSTGTVSGPATTTSGYFPVWNNTAGSLLGAGVAAPAGAVVGTTDAQTLTNKSIAGSEINSGVISVAQIPNLTSSKISDFATAASAAAPVQTVAGVSPVTGNVPLASANLSDASSLVYLGSTQTLTNKTLDGVSPATFGFLDATSSIQTQLNGKQPTLSFTGSGSKTASATGAGAAGHCAQWTSAGDIGDAGAACGTGGTATSPGGSNGQIQFNNSGTFGGLNTIPAANMPAFTGDVTTPAGSTVNTLATVNSTPGTFGSTTSTPVITVNPKGLITSVTTAAISGGNAPASALLSGTLANLPLTCAAAAVYFAVDQPAGQQLYSCSSSNTWTQIGSIGPTGALAYTNGSLDIVTAVVPILTSANIFTGLNSFSNGLQLSTSTAAQPACNVSVRGMFWFENNGASKDGLQICVYNGTAYAWASLY